MKKLFKQMQIKIKKFVCSIFSGILSIIKLFITFLISIILGVIVFKFPLNLKTATIYTLLDLEIIFKTLFILSIGVILSVICFFIIIGMLSPQQKGETPNEKISQ